MHALVGRVIGCGDMRWVIIEVVMLLVVNVVWLLCVCHYYWLCCGWWKCWSCVWLYSRDLYYMVGRIAKSGLLIGRIVDNKFGLVNTRKRDQYTTNQVSWTVVVSRLQANATSIEPTSPMRWMKKGRGPVWALLGRRTPAHQGYPSPFP